MSRAAGRVAMLQGKRLTFDEESRALYDAVAPRHTEAEFAAILAKLEARLPGTGPLIARYEAFKKAFIIPRERLDRVFQAAIRDLPRSHDAVRRAAAGRELHRRVRHRQVVERLQLVSGQLSAA